MDESHTYEWALTHYPLPAAPLATLCNIYGRVMSHTWICHVFDMNESYHPRERTVHRHLHQSPSLEFYSSLAFTFSLLYLLFTFTFILLYFTYLRVHYFTLFFSTCALIVPYNAPYKSASISLPLLNFTTWEFKIAARSAHTHTHTTKRDVKKDL